MMFKKLSNSPIFQLNYYSFVTLQWYITERKYFTDEGGSKKMAQRKILFIELGESKSLKLNTQRSTVVLWKVRKMCRPTMQVLHFYSA